MQTLNQMFSKLAVYGEFFGAIRRAHQHHVVVTGLGEYPFVPLAAKLHQSRVYFDAVEPGADRRFPAESMETFVGGDERVLSGILRIGMVAQHSES